MVYHKQDSTILIMESTGKHERRHRGGTIRIQDGHPELTNTSILVTEISEPQCMTNNRKDIVCSRLILDEISSGLPRAVLYLAVHQDDNRKSCTRTAVRTSK